MPPFLKHYFACDHRMNRKPYLIALIIFFVISMGFSGFVAGQIFSNSSINFVELAQQKAQGAISEEVYKAKIQEVQNSISPWVSIIGLLISLMFLPVFAMRLKDINLPPMLCLLIPLLGIIAMFSRLSGVISPHPVITILGSIIFIGEILLIFIPGTKGPNRYGADPITR